jgi:hypothetical protein
VHRWVRVLEGRGGGRAEATQLQLQRTPQTCTHNTDTTQHNAHEHTHAHTCQGLPQRPPACCSCSGRSCGACTRAPAACVWTAAAVVLAVATAVQHERRPWPTHARARAPTHLVHACGCDRAIDALHAFAATQARLLNNHSSGGAGAGAGAGAARRGSWRRTHTGWTHTHARGAQRTTQGHSCRNHSQHRTCPSKAELCRHARHRCCC